MSSRNSASAAVTNVFGMARMVVLFVVTWLTVLHSAPALCAGGEGGGMGSGGGSYADVSGHLVLLDLYVNGGMVGSSRFLLPRTEAFNKLGIERLNGWNTNSDVFLEAQRRVARWTAPSPVLTRMLLEALQFAPIYYMRYQIGVHDHNYFIPDQFLQNGSISVHTGALTIKNLGVVIDAGAFEKTDSESQVGLIVHEAVRYVNIVYGIALPPENLQLLTKTLIQGSPENENLNTPSMLGHRLYNAVTEVPMATVDIAGACQALQIAINNTMGVNPRLQPLLDAEQACHQPEADLYKMSRFLISATASLDQVFDSILKDAPPRFQPNALAKQKIHEVNLKAADIAMVASREESMAQDILQQQRLDLGLQKKDLNQILKQGIDAANSNGTAFDIDAARTKIDGLLQYGILFSPGK
jgi:hypothetical protein